MRFPGVCVCVCACEGGGQSHTRLWPRWRGEGGARACVCGAGRVSERPAFESARPLAANSSQKIAVALRHQTAKPRLQSLPATRSPPRPWPQVRAFRPTRPLVLARLHALAGVGGGEAARGGARPRIGRGGRPPLIVRAETGCHSLLLTCTRPPPTSVTQRITPPAPRLDRVEGDAAACTPGRARSRRASRRRALFLPEFNSGTHPARGGSLSP